MKELMFQKELIVSKQVQQKECMFCHYWYFKKIGYKSEANVYNKCHDVVMTAYELKNIAILNVKVADYRCIL